MSKVKKTVAYTDGNGNKNNTALVTAYWHDDGRIFLKLKNVCHMVPLSNNQEKKCPK